MAKSDARPTGDQEAVDSIPAGSGNFLHELFCMVILFFPLIQEGPLSISGKRMCTKKITG